MSNVSLIDGHVDNAEHCICFGEVIPEGIQVCPKCDAEGADKREDM